MVATHATTLFYLPRSSTKSNVTFPRSGKLGIKEQQAITSDLWSSTGTLTCSLKQSGQTQPKYVEVVRFTAIIANCNGAT